MIAAPADLAAFRLLGFKVIGMDVVLPDPGEAVPRDPVDEPHAVIPDLLAGGEIVFPEAEARGGGGQLHLLMGPREGLLGHFLAGDVDHHSLPDGDPVRAVPRDGFRAEPADLALDDDPALPEERQFFGEDLEVQGDEGVILLRVNDAEGIEGVGLDLLPGQLDHLEPALAQEGEMRGAVRQHLHDIGADRDVFGEFVDEALFVASVCGERGGAGLLEAGFAGRFRHRPGSAGVN